MPMSESPALCAAPVLPDEAGPRAAGPPSRRLSRRQTVLAIGGLAALIAGSSVVQWRASTSDAGLSAFSPYSAPRELVALRFGDAHGAPKSLADFRGRVVLLNVWAAWCAPCRQEMPTLDRLQAVLGGPDFEVVAVSIDREGLPVAEAFFRRSGIEHLRAYVDTLDEVGTLGAAGIPLTLLIDRDGREAARKLGPATWDDPEVIATIRRFLPDPGKP